MLEEFEAAIDKAHSKGVDGEEGDKEEEAGDAALSQGRKLSMRWEG